jgi:hypothetical protein
MTSMSGDESVTCTLVSLEVDQFRSLQCEVDVEGLTCEQADQHLGQGSVIYQEAVTHNIENSADQGQHMICNSEDQNKEDSESGRETLYSAVCWYEMWANDGSRNCFSNLTSASTDIHHGNQTHLQTLRQQFGVGVVGEQQKTGSCSTNNDPAVSTTSYCQDKTNSSWRTCDADDAVTSPCIQQPLFYPLRSSPHSLSPTSTTGE